MNLLTIFSILIAAWLIIGYVVSLWIIALIRVIEKWLYGNSYEEFKTWITIPND